MGIAGVDILRFLSGDVGGAINGYNTRQDTENLVQDYKAITQSPETFQADYSKYNDIPAASKVLEQFRTQEMQRAAAPVVNALNRYTSNGWGSDMSFSPDEWANGLLSLDNITPNPLNPISNEAINKFRQKNAEVTDAYKAQQLDPMAIARMAANKELASGFENATQGTERFTKRADEAVKAKNLQDFMSSTAMLGTPSERTGQYMPYGEAAQLVRQAAADYPVDASVVNQTVDDLLKQYSSTRTPVSGVTGRTKWTGTKNLLGDINKDVQSTAPVVNVSSGDKNPVFYLIQKPDGRIVQVDATTPEGRARLAAATANGERIGKMGTESVTSTTMEDNNITTRRVSGFGAKQQQQKPAINVVRDKNGKLTIQRQ